MPRKQHEKVSQREYARRLGVSNEAVSKAVREGRIKKGWNAKEKKIIVAHADLEFGNIYKNTSEAPTYIDAGGEIPEPKSKPKKQTDTDRQATDAGPKMSDDNGLLLTGKSSYSDARKVKEILQAQLVALDLRQRKGELVEKEIVFNQLFAFGQNIRISLLAIPDRYIDNIMASKTRSEAHNILTQAIHENLEKLTAVEGLNFQEQ